MLIQYTLSDNSQDQYIIFKAVKNQHAFYTKEESWQFNGREYNYNPSISDVSLYSTADTYTELNNHIAGASYTVPINGANSATDYIGAAVIPVPTLIKEAFIEATYISLVSNPLDGLTNISLPIETGLFNTSDTNKVVNLYNGLQALRIPASKFNDTNSEPVYGKYMVKLSPKYIDATVTGVTNRRHQTWPVDPNTAEGRRKVYAVSNNAFKLTPWNFEGSSYQSGRLYGSVVEVWDSTKTILKTTKIMMEDIFNFSGSDASLVLGPDLVGFEAVNEVIAIGDVLRIYPRETSFEPVFFDIDHIAPNNTVNEVLAYLRNDAVRDLTGDGVIEVYDENGVTLDNQGNAQGNVILTYQITSDGKKEIRKRIN